MAFDFNLSRSTNAVPMSPAPAAAAAAAGAIGTRPYTPSQGQEQYGHGTSAAACHTANAPSFNLPNASIHTLAVPVQGQYGYHSPYHHSGHSMPPVQTMTALSLSNDTQVGNAFPPNDTEKAQTHLNTIVAFVDDPTEVCNELVAHCGTPKAAEILREVAEYVPFLEQIGQQKKNKILRSRAEAKHYEAEAKRHEAEAKRHERELRQIMKYFKLPAQK